MPAPPTANATSGLGGIEMRRKLRLACVVEGAETDDELQTIQQAGGVPVQEYFFGKPVTADRVPHFLEQGINLMTQTVRGVV